VAFAVGSHDFATADAASGVTVYRNLDGRLLAVLGAGRDWFTEQLAFSIDGKRVFVSAAGCVR
jgi:hypothetical protein